jgi:hypothetical protein
MKLNVGSSDKVIRLVIGVAMLAAGYFYQSWWGLVGLIPIGTALVNFCPAYALLGLSTRKGS